MDFAHPAGIQSGCFLGIWLNGLDERLRLMISPKYYLKSSEDATQAFTSFMRDYSAEFAT